MSGIWDKALQGKKIETPKMILEQIGRELYEMSAKSINGEIKSIDSRNSEFVFKFNLKSEVINYSYNLLTISHGIELYPVYISVEHEILGETDISDRYINTIIKGYPVSGVPCENEEDFRECITKLIQTERTTRIVQSILSLT